MYDPEPITTAAQAGYRPQPSPFLSEWRDQLDEPLPTRRPNVLGVAILIAAAVAFTVLVTVFALAGA